MDRREVSVNAFSPYPGLAFMGCLIPGLSWWYPRHVSCLRLLLYLWLITKQIRRSDTALKYPAFLPPLR